MFGDVLGSQFHAQRDSPHLPVIEFPAGALTFAFIESHTDVGFYQLGLQFARSVEDGHLLFVRLEDGDNHNLTRRKLRREDEALIVAVDHDNGPNDACGEPPRCRPAMLQLAVLVEVFNLEGLGEILSQKVRRA